MTIVVIKTIMEIGPKKMKEEDTMRGNARILTVLLCLTLILGLCGCGCSCRHEWVDATCTEPKTCAKCGETQGEARGHTPGEW